MSDDDKNVKDLLTKIDRKLGNSPALNGGFEKLATKIDYLTEKQVETWEKVNELSSTLYKPDDGLFARVKTNENDYETISKKLDENQKKDNEFYHNFKSLGPSITEISLITEKLKTVAGNDLNKLNELIVKKSKLDSNKEKINWLVITAFIGLTLKFLFEAGQTFFHWIGTVFH